MVKGAPQEHGNRRGDSNGIRISERDAMHKDGKKDVISRSDALKGSLSAVLTLAALAGERWQTTPTCQFTFYLQTAVNQKIMLSIFTCLPLP